MVERLAREYPLNITWVGYELRPERPVEGERLDKLYPDMDIKAVYNNFNKLGADYGVVFNPPKLMPNTRLALIATELAKDQGKFEEFHSAVFKAYFTDGRNIGDREVILALAAGVGLPPEQVAAAWEDEGYRHRIKKNRELGQTYQVAGIPTFIIAGQEKIVGAQSYDFFKRVLDKVKNS
ncbi:DSBA oxidoreductase [Desulfotomaculum nigrificans CO-1-SRB]|uniref:DSBA oxidoreductase n=1 Tax=Desulfotomaculum nigrificans (strain DSM 14880 / VKM B-2319 / CO-1-SRB) TaxID=868595 RepID=F6BA15_DESCC|nr:DSBA oxidoreductase [Desulfotomaculum nigrificans CO-1-SRB]